jgi:hypothetical protein
VLATLFHFLLLASLGLAQEKPRKIKPPPKKAGAWLFQSITLPGNRNPLQIAALPAASGYEQTGNRIKAPQLVFYCLAGENSTLRAFLELPQPLVDTASIPVTVNGRSAGSILPDALIAGEQNRLKLPGSLITLVERAEAVEFHVNASDVRFVLLHWEGIREQLLRGYR